MNSKNLSNVLTLTRFTSWHIVGFLEDKFSARGLAENVVYYFSKTCIPKYLSESNVLS